VRPAHQEDRGDEFSVSASIFRVRGAASDDRDEIADFAGDGWKIGRRTSE
jgi:hypothetical protein